jgi:glycosyltransferase involved in cell wall biosynthesis
MKKTLEYLKCKKKNKQKIMALTSYLLSRPERAAAMGAAGRARAADLFDVDAMVRRTADLYRALSAGKGAAHALA